MKHWYIVLIDREEKCAFVSVSASSKTLILKWPTGVNVKIIIHDFKYGYKDALDGNQVTCFAVSSNNRRVGKPIAVVFK